MNPKIRTTRSRAPAKFRSNGQKKSRPGLLAAHAQAEKPATDFQPNRKAAKVATSKRFPVVGVGASAGGLDAFIQLLQNLPELGSFGIAKLERPDFKARSSAFFRLR
jgi:chemotaxis response regulator CheB